MLTVYLRTVISIEAVGKTYKVIVVLLFVKIFVKLYRLFQDLFSIRDYPTED